MCASYGVKQIHDRISCQHPSGQSLHSIEESAEKSENLSDRHAGLVYWLALSLTGDPVDAGDILQNTLMKAKPATAFGQNESPLAALMRITLAEVSDKLCHRGNGNFPILDDDRGTGELTAPKEVVEWSSNAGEHYTREELQKIVHDAIDALAPFPRVAFLLRDVAGLRTEEIADLLRRPLPSVKAQLLQGRLQVRERLNPYFKLS